MSKEERQHNRHAWARWHKFLSEEEAAQFAQQQKLRAGRSAGKGGWNLPGKRLAESHVLQIVVPWAPP